MESAVAQKLDITELNALPTFVMEDLYVLIAVAAVFALACIGEY